LTFARHLDVLKIHLMRTDKTPQFHTNTAIHAHCMNGRIAMMAVGLSLQQTACLGRFRHILSNARLARLSGQHGVWRKACAHARLGQRIPDAQALP
jgi:hypothetical protein